MNLFGVLDVSGSALKAERIRAEVVAANMANSETTRTVDGGPYRRQHVVFQAANAGGEQSFAASLLGQGNFGSIGFGPMPGLNGPGSMGIGQMAGLRRIGILDSANAAEAGVQVTGVIADQSAPLQRYDPQHPDAGPDGYVAYPDINPLTEMVDLMGAQRSYGMNTSAIQAEKGMIVASLDIGK